MAGVRIHHELGVWQVLCQDEGVNWRDDDVLVPMHDQGGLADPVQHRIAVRRGNGAPLADCLHLGTCRLLGDRRIAVRGANFQPFNIRSPAAWLASLGVKNAPMSRATGSSSSSAESSVKVIPSPPRGPAPSRMIRRIMSG